MNKKTHPKNRLHEQIGQMISLESAIEQKLGELIPEVSAHTAASALLTSFLSLPRDPRLALENRLHTLSEEAPQIISPGSVIVPGTMNEGENHPVSAALQLAHTIFNQAVIGYAVLVPLGTRFLDSSFIADQGTSFHLAKQHMQNYASGHSADYTPAS